MTPCLFDGGRLILGREIRGADANAATKDVRRKRQETRAQGGGDRGNALGAEVWRGVEGERERVRVRERERVRESE
jgi:hypothetical protein